jgi:hypothetical protein
VHEHHRRWGDRTVTEENLIYCERKGVEEYIQELERDLGGVAFNWMRRRTWMVGFLGAVPGLRNLFKLGGEWSYVSQSDPGKLGDARRLDDLLRYMLQHRLFSPFVGEPVEWRALDGIARSALLAQVAPSESGGEGRMLRGEDEAVAALASSAFLDSLEQSTKKLCYFSALWDVTRKGSQVVFRAKADLEGLLTVESTPVSTLEFTFSFGAEPSDEKLERLAESKGAAPAWVLGRIVDRMAKKGKSNGAFGIGLKVLAVLKETDRAEA